MAVPHIAHMQSDTILLGGVHIPQEDMTSQAHPEVDVDGSYHKNCIHRL